MTEVINNLFVGSDADVEKAKEHGFAVVSCCKDGPNGHRSVLKYTSRAAPKSKDYYSVERGKHLALNLIDPQDPAFIPNQAIDAALGFIQKHLTAGDRVLVHCNHGHSRGPSTALMYLRSAGEMPHSFVQSERVFHTLYPHYDPQQGIRQYARSRWGELTGEAKEKD